MAARVLLVEIQTTSPTGVSTILRFSDRAIRPMPPTDGLRPNVGFDSRLIEAPAIRRQLFEDLATMAPALGVGVLTLSNADHALDAYEGHAWGEIGVWLWTEGSPSTDARLVLAGLCAAPAYVRAAGQPGRVRMALYDYAAEAARPLQPNLYAGTNGTGGVLYEGGQDGLKGTPKPLSWGDLREAQIPAPLVNPAEQAHQLHDGPIAGTEALFDRGDAFGLVDDGDLAGAAFDAANPAAAHYRTDLGRGLVKFNATPVGQFTAGFKGEAGPGGYVETAGPILERLLRRAGVPPGRIGASVGMLASSSVIGFHAGQVTTLGEALRFVSAGVPAAVLPGRSGIWQALAFGPPAATPDVVLGPYDLVAEPVTDEAASAPVGEIRVGWGRIWKTFTGTELAADLVQTDAQVRLAEDYRWAVAADPVVQARFPAWRTISLPTALRQAADAQALLLQLKALLALKEDGRPRRLWRVTISIETALAHDLGASVQLTYPGQGLSGNFLLVGEEPLRPRRDQAIWTLWG